MRRRLIAKLEIKSENVVKPIFFEGLRVIGNPNKIAKSYYIDGVDEIFLVDIVASLYRRSINYDLIRNISKELFIPLTVAGGIKKLDDISKLLEIGADKVSINTHAIQNDPSLINRAARKFGSQCILSNLEVKKIDKEWFCLSDGGRILSNRTVFDWMRELEKRGVGEILIQSVDFDGSLNGFDIDLFSQIKEKIKINTPLIHCSGAGNIKHIKDLIRIINPNSICVSTVLHDNILKIKQIKKILND